MVLNSTYRRLFEVKIYHRYFLNDGITDFEDTDALKDKQLSKYDHREFLRVIPSAATQNHLRNHRLLLKLKPEGLYVLVQAEQLSSNPSVYAPLIPLDEELTLDFILTSTDPLFLNYSDLDSADGLPLYFSNRKPTLDAAGYPYINRLTENNPAKAFTISPLSLKILQERFSNTSLTQALGIISLSVKAEKTNLNLTLANGNLPQNSPKFKLLFENRSTIWRYYNSTDPTPVHTTEPNPKPLVKNGLVPISEGNIDYPAATPNSLVLERDVNGTIIKSYSNIYIN